MYKSFFLSLIIMISVSAEAQTIARMDDLTAEQKSMAINLRLTGTLSIRETQTLGNYVISVGSYVKPTYLKPYVIPFPLMPFTHATICNVSYCLRRSRR